MPFHTVQHEKARQEAWKRHFDSFDSKELKEALDLAEDIAKAIGTGSAPKLLRSLRRFLQLLFRDLDRLAKRENVSFQKVGRNKFMIRSENPGHGFFVQFAPLHFPTQFEIPDPEEREAHIMEELPPAGRFIRQSTRDLLEAVFRMQRFFHDVQQFPEEVAKQLPRFGETSVEFHRRRREETGMPARTRREEFWGVLEPWIPAGWGP